MARVQALATISLCKAGLYQLPRTTAPYCLAANALPCAGHVLFPIMTAALQPTCNVLYRSRLVVSHEFHFEWHEDMYRGALEVRRRGWCVLCRSPACRPAYMYGFMRS